MKLKYKDGTTKIVEENKILKELYYNLAELSDNTETNKNKLSLIDNYLPLFDIKTKNIYLINKNNINFRVIYDYYRLPDTKLLDKMIKKYNVLKQNIKNGRIQML